MALSPEEIVSYDLKQTVRGYSVAQVDDLLDQLADQVEAADLERERLAARLREAEERAAASQETESTLKRTLITAQQAAERSLQEAREEAEALLERARDEARELEDEARREGDRVLEEARAMASAEAEETRRRRAALQERVDELVERERRHRARLRELLERELEELDAMEEELGGSTTIAEHEGPEEPSWWEDLEEDEEPPGEAPADTVPGGPEGHGLRVRLHERADDLGSDSPLGSAPLRDEE